GTVVADDPSLTARTTPTASAGSVGPQPGLADHQPLRVVVGLRDLPPHVRLAPGGAWTTDGGGPVLHVRTHDVRTVLAELAVREVRHVLVEGGPGLATAFLASGAVDEIHVYLAPVLLGAGLGAVGDLGVSTLTEALRFTTHDVRRLGEDVLVVARPSVHRPSTVPSTTPEQEK
ncbi:riboflavin biosynthesis protein RibD, partial [Actinotalea fermentans ATCC 43279 = JCM 9966 = DSM 3133]